MTLLHFLFLTIRHHWRTSLAVLLGVIVGSAVISGALVVGDSVRDSLKQMTLARLGRIDHVLESPRFFREQLASDLGSHPDFARDYATAAPAIGLTCGFQHEHAVPAGPNEKTISRAGKVNLFGVDQRFWDLTEHADFAHPIENEVVLSQRLADQLRVKAGKEVSLWLEIPSSIPRESLLGKREAGTLQLTLTVKSVLPEALGLGRLGLRPNQQLPMNAFMSLQTLQESLKVNEVRPTFRDRSSSPARVNQLFVAARDEAHRSIAASGQLTKLLSSVLMLRDLDLRIVDHPKRGYFALESDRMILEDSIASLALRMAENLKLRVSPVYVYLANELSTSKSDKTYSMYSVVAGMEFQQQSPFGPYRFVGPPPQLPLKEDEIVINQWLAEDLQAEIGDQVKVKYHVIGSRGELPEESKEFRVSGILKFEDTIAADRGVTPEVKGITDVKTLSNWDAPFPMDYQRITDRDHIYWDQFRATPKAFMSLKTAQHLWQSRYGQLTSLRVQRFPGERSPEMERLAGNALLESLPLDRLGMAFSPVKALGLRASSGTTDFGGLFIGFSFFLIASAAILIRLLFRLGVEQRVSQIGLLEAIGFSPHRVAKMLFWEGLLLVVTGSLLGLLAGVGYADLMLYGLKTWWVKAIGTKFLFLSVNPLSLGIGFAISVCVAGFSVWRVFGQLQAISIRSLLAGQSQVSPSLAESQRSASRAKVVCLTNVLLTTLLVAGSAAGLIPDTQGLGPLSWKTVAFFLGGMCSLVAGLSGLSWWLAGDSSVAVRGRGVLGLARLSLRNAARNRSRSILTASLLASATFLIVAVASGQRNPTREEPEKNSGNGGFTLVAESSSPILFDLNRPEGRKALNLDDAEFSAAWKRLGNPQVFPFRVKPGDDASCLNIYQTQLPTVLGAPRDFLNRGGFRFVGMSEKNPWSVLDQKFEDKSVPVFGDMNTLMYSLHKGVGVKLGVPNDQTPDHQLRISGMFDGAVFQGVLVMTEERFLETFPQQAGYQYFLIEVAPEHAAELSDLLETRLVEFGFDAEKVSERLADFLSVQNTYLSTFQALGGLGLLLGTLGLAAVMLRNVLERQRELALLRSVGFSNWQTATLVLGENSVLLLWGLIVGSASALLAMLPHLLSIGADIPWGTTAQILIAVFAVGMLAALAAVRSALNFPIVETLKSEA